MKIYFFKYEEIVELKNYCSGGLACIASVSVWFRSKERPTNGIFGFSRAKKGTRTKNPFFAPFFVRSLTLIPCSLLRNCTETLATQATRGSVTIIVQYGVGEYDQALLNSDGSRAGAWEAGPPLIFRPN